MDGVLNVLKPAGMTSFDVIACLRRIYGQKKIGHGGTLDPLAAGVLPVFLGRAARLIEYAPIHRKTYEAEFLMGLGTDTEDVSGHILHRGPVLADRPYPAGAISLFRQADRRPPRLRSGPGGAGGEARAEGRDDF